MVSKHPNIKIFRLDHAIGLNLPHYATSGSAGADIEAANNDDVILKPSERALIPTGFKMEIPIGYEIQIRPRSGLALKHGITCLNTPGTIDSDYRGEIAIILINLSQEDFTIHRGMRIAQMAIADNTQATFTETSSLIDSTRGDGGFGSTGI